MRGVLSRLGPAHAFAIDGFLHWLNILVDFGVPKADYMPSGIRDEPAPLFVHDLDSEMGLTVDFDNPMAFDTGEIDDVRADRMLPSELEAGQRAVAKSLPK